MDNASFLEAAINSGMEEVAPNSWVRKDSPWADMMTKVFQRAEELYQEDESEAAA